MLYPDGTFVSYEYEHTFSRRTRETDENGIATAYVYDDIGNLIRKIEAVDTADERITTYTYDADGNLLNTTRLADAGAKALFVSDGGFRRGRSVPMKPVADEALAGLGGQLLVEQLRGAVGIVELQHERLDDGVGPPEAGGVCGVALDLDGPAIHDAYYDATPCRTLPTGTGVPRGNA